MEILLDTNFILTCTKRKIHFAELANALTSEQIKWLVPQDVLNELGCLKDNPNTSPSDRAAAELSFQILQSINPEIIELPEKKNPNVDIKIVNYILDKPIVLATMDKNLKSRVQNKILSVRGQKNIQFL